MVEIPTRVPVTLADVLEAFEELLRAQLNLTESTCFWCLDADEVPPPASSDMFVTITPDGGRFDAAAFEGGGAAQLLTDTAVGVTIWSTSRQDRGNRDEAFLLAGGRGVIRLMTDVLRALAGKDLRVKGELCLTAQIPPEGFMRPVRHRKANIGGVLLTFGVGFVWRLTPE